MGKNRFRVESSRWLRPLAMLCGFLVATGCVAGQMMTQETYTEVRAGMSLSEVEAIAGKPWDLRPLPADGAEAVYCERIRFGGECREERRYILIFQEGRLVSKRIQVEGPPKKIGRIQY
jgi:hypothetical protein